METKKTKTLMTNGSLMKVESITECSKWSILQYCRLALSDNRSCKASFGLRFELALKEVNILAIILVPLIMTISRGHTGQIKRTVIMR